MKLGAVAQVTPPISEGDLRTRAGWRVPGCHITSLRRAAVASPPN